MFRCLNFYIKDSVLFSDDNTTLFDLIWVDSVRFGSKNFGIVRLGWIQRNICCSHTSTLNLWTSSAPFCNPTLRSVRTDFPFNALNNFSPQVRSMKHCGCNSCAQLSTGLRIGEMESLYSLPYEILEVPNLKVKWPSWFRQPSAMAMYAMVLVSYFLVTGGIIYDIITETPGYGSVSDERGQRTVAIMPHRVNGQYVIEGLTSSFMFTIGGLGFVVLNQTHNPSTPKFNRILLIAVGFICIIVAFSSCFVFMRIKLPGYLQL